MGTYTRLAKITKTINNTFSAERRGKSMCYYSISKGVDDIISVHPDPN